MKEIFLVFSMFLTIAFVLNLLTDIIKIAIAKFSGKEYSCSSLRIFTEADSPIIVLILGAMLIGGVYGFYIITVEHITEELSTVEVKCDYCDQWFPEYYETRDSFWTICPNCTNKEINALVRLETSICTICADTYDIDDGKNGMCWNCYLDESAECNWCGNAAPSNLYDENGEHICIDCITEALQDSKVARAIRNYYEYG